VKLPSFLLQMDLVLVTDWRRKHIPILNRRRSLGMSETELIKPPPFEVKKPLRPKLLDVLGPGLTTGASDDDPSGIATYSQAGAQFGYAIGWTMLFSYPLMCAIQLVSAQIGRVTGRGIAGNMRRYMPAWLLYGVVALLLGANTINIGADLGAMAAALKLLIPISLPVGVAGFTIVSVLLQVFVRYSRYVSVLKWLTISLFAYVATVFIVGVPWGHAISGIFLPRLKFNSDYLTVIVAVLGTTISPYLFFWQAGEEVEKEKEDDNAQPLKTAPAQAPSEMRRIRWDTYVGMALSNIVALAIIITTAATLNAHGITNITTSSQAAKALKPIAGQFAFAIFAIGIIGTGLLAVPVMAGSAAYAMGEAFKWPVGLAMKAKRAKAFYGTITVAFILGALMNFSPLDPIKALFWSAVVNGVVAVPVMVMMMILASRKVVMGEFTLGPILKIFGWIATGVMALAAVGMFATIQW
jgi:NRAMP (natural resistance-associated macrophage protein)-like metal ion transporter